MRFNFWLHIQLRYLHGQEASIVSGGDGRNNITSSNNSSCNHNTISWHSSKTKGRPADDTSVIHRTVMRMMDPLIDQRYTVYTDQFYTSGHLFKELYDRRTLACSTVQKNRKGVPADLKNIRVFLSYHEVTIAYVFISKYNY